MAREAIHGTCEDCGKSFKVPSAERTYTCKSCGGVVGVWDDEDDLEPEVEEPAEKRQLSRRARSERSKVGLWVTVLSAVVVMSLGLGYQAGLFSTVEGSAGSRDSETDLVKVNLAFAEAWQAGDTRTLSFYHHPTGRAKFQERLEAIAEHRGWGATWPKLELQGAKEKEGSPKTGLSSAAFGDSSLTANWQYAANAELWVIYDFWISPPALATRADAFREAWATSDPGALGTFFHPDSAEKMEALVEKLTAKRGWTGNYPALESAAISGEEQSRSKLAGMLTGGKVESVFESSEGPITVRWKFRQAEDEWCVSGFGMPKE